MPKVLIADELSPKALAIFRSRGVEVDVRVGLKKADKDVIGAAKMLKVIGRAGNLFALQPVLLAADGPAVSARRLLDSMIKKEMEEARSDAEVRGDGNAQAVIHPPHLV